MAMATERPITGLRIEGDLGDLQIIEESSESDDDGVTEIEAHKDNTVGNIPSNLMQPGTTPVFGTVAVNNSENVQFGNNTFFNGPVTIKQVIQNTSGYDNASYVKTECESPNRKFHSKEEPPNSRKFQLKTWVKLTFSFLGIVAICSILAGILLSMNSDRSQDSQNSHNDNRDSSNNALVMGYFYRTYYEIFNLVIFIAIITYLSWVIWLTLTNDSSSCKQYINMLTTSTTAQNCLRNNADNILIAPGHLRIVSRTDWLAQPVEEKIDKLRQPVPWVIITHTATEGCFTQSACVLRVRQMQTFHIESKGWSDIGYNFMVGGDGSAYYGRGWDQIAAHTKGYNKYSIGIAFIGTFNTESPSKNQVDACKKLIEWGVEQGKIATDYKLFAHRQLMSTLSPGDKVFNIIKTWPHFVNETDIASLVPKY